MRMKLTFRPYISPTLLDNRQLDKGFSLTKLIPIVSGTGSVMEIF